MIDKNDLLLSMYNEQVAQARQHETMRGTATSLTFAIGSAIVSLIAASKTSETEPLAILLIFIGTFGCLISLKHYERNRMHTKIAHAYRDSLEKALPESNLSALRAIARQRNELAHPLLSKVPLNWLWASSSLLFCAAGLLILALGHTATG